MTDFEKRRLGRSALKVTALGLGCATLGGSRVPVSREEAQAIVRAAWAAGVRYVDAAPFYGFGQAERCVGDALRDMPRDEWVLSTKVGRLLRPQANPAATEPRQNRMPFDAMFDYSYDAIMRSYEDSLQRLGLAKSVKGRGVDITHSGRPSRTHDAFGLLATDRHPAAAEGCTP